MADILDGKTAHTHFAPLSQAQTIQISRHLQDQMRKLEVRLDDIDWGYKRNQEAIASLKEGSAALQGTVSSIQDVSSSTRNAVECARKELARNNGFVQKLQGSLDQSLEGMASMRDVQKVTTASIKKMGQDLSGTHSLAIKLQEGVERRIDVDVAQLRDELSKTNLELKHVRADDALLKQALHEEREALRQVNNRVKAIADDLAEHSALAGINEQRLGEATADLKITRLGVDELNVICLKLNEEQVNTKNIVNELFSSVKRVTLHAKEVDETVAEAVAQLALTQGKLDDKVEMMDGLRQTLDQTQTKVLGLRDGHEMTKGQLTHLRAELTQVGSTAQAVKAALKETSSLLLPNISMDNSEVKVSAGRHGSILGGRAGSGVGVGAPSPRQKTSIRSAGASPRNMSQALGQGGDVVAWT